ncbi:hypothetical protein EDC44_1503 [Cricetibacter osteomyelitidis]|uniref:Uncharacterized protein n=1 Tax=Cricetibacter osteomyelitidis TaxID=1521931 RepID=A0A4V2T075_9PAST|nr:hypothetical protein [Cricetibacter osteomyelitidis]TCP88663.1 hypothetical protein EDC44_1503 [Cricetibacter osteomyelitidis]
MKKLLFFILIFYMRESFAESQIIFEQADYQLILESEKNCSNIYFLDKKLNKKDKIIIPVTNTLNQCFNNKDVSPYKSDLYSFKLDRYLRVDYQEIEKVSDGLNNEIIRQEKCAILDLKTLVLINSASARDEICTEDNYQDYLFRFIGFPVTTEALIQYLNTNQNLENGSDNLELYINILLANGLKIDEITMLAKVLYEKNLKKQYFELIKIRYIKNKTFLYNSFNDKTKMYLIRGDKVSILNQKIDENNQKWYFINYKGKREINMWIKAEDIDIK